MSSNTALTSTKPLRHPGLSILPLYNILRYYSPEYPALYDTPYNYLNWILTISQDFFILSLKIIVVILDLLGFNLNLKNYNEFLTVLLKETTRIFNKNNITTTTAVTVIPTTTPEVSSSTQIITAPISIKLGYLNRLDPLPTDKIYNIPEIIELSCVNSSGVSDNSLINGLASDIVYNEINTLLRRTNKGIFIKPRYSDLSRDSEGNIIIQQELLISKALKDLQTFQGITTPPTNILDESAEPIVNPTSNPPLNQLPVYVGSQQYTNLSFFETGYFQNSYQTALDKANRFALVQGFSTSTDVLADDYIFRLMLTLDINQAILAQYLKNKNTSYVFIIGPNIGFSSDIQAFQCVDFLSFFLERSSIDFNVIGYDAETLNSILTSQGKIEFLLNFFHVVVENQLVEYLTTLDPAKYTEVTIILASSNTEIYYSLYHWITSQSTDSRIYDNYNKFNYYVANDALLSQSTFLLGDLSSSSSVIQQVGKFLSQIGLSGIKTKAEIDPTLIIDQPINNLKAYQPNIRFQDPIEVKHQKYYKNLAYALRKSKMRNKLIDSSRKFIVPENLETSDYRPGGYIKGGCDHLKGSHFEPNTNVLNAVRFGTLGAINNVLDPLINDSNDDIKNALYRQAKYMTLDGLWSILDEDQQIKEYIYQLVTFIQIPDQNRVTINQACSQFILVNKAINVPNTSKIPLIRYLSNIDTNNLTSVGLF
jgi:hypothetical protein